MCNDLVIRRFAGVFVLLSLALGYWVHPAWLLFTAFVGLNLLQSSFTHVCPLERMLGRAGLMGCAPAGRSDP
ncbi:MAG TPA: DUF2892 domain-containing protein [Gemmatimonadaceae bacterium]|nr:DUF2892 domain-containing protein [Gemmatimonadaceae bacterium]